METQIKTVITIEHSDTKFYVKESADEILTMIKNTMGNNFITLTLITLTPLHHSNVVSDKLYIRAKSIIAIHKYKSKINQNQSLLSIKKKISKES